MGVCCGSGGWVADKTAHFHNRHTISPLNQLREENEVLRARLATFDGLF